MQIESPTTMAGIVAAKSADQQLRGSRGSGRVCPE